MATVRLNASKEPETEVDKPWNEMTLSEKWRHKTKSVKGRKESAKAAYRYAQLTYAIQSTTQIHVFLWHIIPRLFEEYSPWTQYFLKVITVFVCIEWFMNYFCCIFYTSNITVSRDKPNLNQRKNGESPPEYFDSYILKQQNSNGHVVKMETNNGDENETDWEFCKECNIKTPPRAHHCYVCQACILKRDHHCYFVGTCIGVHNQRYFYVLTFYSLIVGFVGFYFTNQYLQTFFWSASTSWTNIFPPFAFWNWISGSGSKDLQFHIVILITHLYLEILCGLLGTLYFCGQTFLVISGLTMYELAKSQHVKNRNSLNQKFKGVFGDVWLLNFLFPMIILFKEHEDGYHWKKIFFNSNRAKLNSIKVY